MKSVRETNKSGPLLAVECRGPLFVCTAVLVACETRAWCARVQHSGAAHSKEVVISRWYNKWGRAGDGFGVFVGPYKNVKTGHAVGA